MGAVRDVVRLVALTNLYGLTNVEKGEKLTDILPQARVEGCRKPRRVRGGTRNGNQNPGNYSNGEWENEIRSNPIEVQKAKQVILRGIRDLRNVSMRRDPTCGYV